MNINRLSEKPVGSFMSGEARSKMYSAIETSGVSELLSKEDIDNNEQVDNSHKPYEEPKTEEKRIEEYDSNKPCPVCGRSGKFTVEFTDEEVLNYLLGSRISKEFSIGPINIRLQTLTQGEVDESNYRTGKNVDAGEAYLDFDIRNRNAFYLMVFQLTHINGKQVGPPMPNTPSQLDIEKWYSEKAKVLRSFGHQFIIFISQKCVELENSIRSVIEDQVRLKK